MRLSEILWLRLPRWEVFGPRGRRKSRFHGRAGPLGPPRLRRSFTSHAARPAVAPYLFRRPLRLLALAIVLTGHAAAAQSSVPAPAAVTTKEAWSFAASAYAYFVPEDTDYVQPTLTADLGQLHLEARYNYENLDTGSVWIGANFSGGDRLTWEFTPMLGGVFGDTKGVAPGYKGFLGWGMLELYSEGEYVFDSGGSADSFFYNWAELTLAPLEWLRFGVVAQRTKAYDSEREIQRGLLVGLTFKHWYVTGHVFNLDLDKPMTVFAVGLTF